MALTLESIRPATAEDPPRILLYGPPGVGKTTLAAEFPNPILIRPEDGLPANVIIDAFPKPATFEDVMEQLAVLYTSEHEYKTLVVDSMTELQKLVFAETCARGDDKGNAKRSIEDFGYGKGYVFAMGVLEDFVTAINALRSERGMAIVLIAHSNVERFNDPESESYDRYSVALRTSDKTNSDLRGRIEREMDAILLMNTPKELKKEDQGNNRTRNIASGGRVRMIYTEGAPAYTAKNRYGLPQSLRYDMGQGAASMISYFPGLAQFANQPVQEAA